jgi:hypothetical protein
MVVGNEDCIQKATESFANEGVLVLTMRGCSDSRRKPANSRRSGIAGENAGSQNQDQDQHQHIEREPAGAEEAKKS